jgi:hypothetical protein
MRPSRNPDGQSWLACCWKSRRDVPGGCGPRPNTVESRRRRTTGIRVVAADRRPTPSSSCCGRAAGSVCRRSTWPESASHGKAKRPTFLGTAKREPISKGRGGFGMVSGWTMVSGLPVQDSHVSNLRRRGPLDKRQSLIDALLREWNISRDWRSNDARR